ncbi:MAG: hypothetical protein QOG39_933 [Acidimicrobiaceae bacterium]
MIVSAVTPLAVAPPLLATLAKHSGVNAYGNATRPVSLSHVSMNVRSVRPFELLNVIAPAGSAPLELFELLEPEDVAAGFLSSFPLNATMAAITAITTTIATTGP